MEQLQLFDLDLDRAASEIESPAPDSRKGTGVPSERPASHNVEVNSRDEQDYLADVVEAVDSIETADSAGALDIADVVDTTDTVDSADAPNIDEDLETPGEDRDNSRESNRQKPGVPTEKTAASDILFDLSAQQRNLLLLSPLFELHQNKSHVANSDGAAGFMTNIDTHYLSLSLLDFLMEGVAIGSGQYPEEVLQHLMALAGVIAPSLNHGDLRKIAEYVLGQVANSRENYKDFEREYFDAKTKCTQAHRFKLITFEPDLEENYLFKPTEEGYLVYLGMLDLSPEDAAELMEKMLQLLIKRNKFAQAVDIAKRARALSIEFRQIIRDTITRARRTPRAVNWKDDIQVRLEKARGHVTERRKEDGTMMLSVRNSLAGADEFEVRENIIKLLDILQSSSNLRSRLHTEIMQAPDQYLTAHSMVFRVRAPSSLPSLEELLFPHFMKLPVETLAACVDNMISSAYPPKFPHIFDLNNVFALLLDKRASPNFIEEDEGEVEPEQLTLEMFSFEEIEQAEQWIDEKLRQVNETTIEKLLTGAEEEGLDRPVVLCAALFLYIAINESSNYKNIEISINEHSYRTKYVRGTSLTLKRRGNS